MNLEFYIQQLLFEFDCVIIPDFGGLVAQSVSAAIHQNKNVFYAPKKLLAFNRNLNKTDGLLVNHVAIKQSISYKQATDWVAQEVSNWIVELNSKSHLSVSEIGRFKLDKESNIVFEPVSFVNYNLEAFGCNSFQVSLINEVQSLSQQKIQTKVVNKPRMEAEKKIKYRKIIPYVIAVPLIIAAIALPVKTGLINKGSFYSNLNPFASNNSANAKYSERIPVTLPSNTFNVPSVDSNSNQETVNPIVSEQEKVLKKENNIKPSDANSSVYLHLIAGSFGSKENAEALISILKGKGYEAYIQGKNSNGLYRVSCNKFQLKTDALVAKENLKQLGFDTWLLQE